MWCTYYGRKSAFINKNKSAVLYVCNLEKCFLLHVLGVNVLLLGCALKEDFMA